MAVNEGGITRPGGKPAPSPLPKPDLSALGVTDASSREDILRKAEAVAELSRGLRRMASQKVIAPSRVTPTQQRSPELDADPSLVWTGAHYQQIG